MKPATFLLASVLAFGLAACDDEPDAPTEATEEAPEETTAAAEAQAEAPPEPTRDEVPIPLDFAAEAKGEITADNYEAKLDSLSAELDKELAGGE